MAILEAAPGRSVYRSGGRIAHGYAANAYRDRRFHSAGATKRGDGGSAARFAFDHAEAHRPGRLLRICGGRRRACFAREPGPRCAGFPARPRRNCVLAIRRVPRVPAQYHNVTSCGAEGACRPSESVGACKRLAAPMRTLREWRPRCAVAQAMSPDGHAVTFWTMFHISRSRSPSWLDPGRRVFVRAAQQKPLLVRTMSVIVPGRLPLCQ